MSKHILLKTICVSFIGICCGWGISRFMNTETFTLSRHVASIPPMTKLGLDPVSYDYVDIKIENVSIAEKKDETSLVHARITALKNIPTVLNYQWILGKDVITSDSLVGSLDPMVQGESKLLEFRVQNYSKEWQSHVSLALTGYLANHPVNRQAIISSRPEDSFEFVVQQAEQQNKRAPTGKVQKLSSGKTVKEKFRPENVVR